MATVYELAAVPQALRDGAWQADFFIELPAANVLVVDETPASGPDGWPYLKVELNQNSSEPLTRVLGWLSTRGIGVVVNAQKELPDAVLTYGMIWNFRQTGRFFTVENESNIVMNGSPSESRFLLQKGQIAHAGTPSEQYLPGYVRNILRAFFHDNGVEKPKVLVLSEDRKRYDLCFSVESLGNPKQSEHSGILEVLAWFLPAHYSLVLASEAGLPSFVVL